MSHDNSKNSIFAIGINMTLACIVSGIIIAVVYTFTAPIAVEQKAKLENESRQIIIQNADSFKEIPEHVGWFEAYKEGKLEGYIVASESKGYGGSIKMLVGVTPDGKIIAYKILSMNETPGLGDAAAKPAFSDQFIGKKSDDLVVVKQPTKENIQALTGATITSKAVTKAVKQAVDELNEYVAEKSAN